MSSQNYSEVSGFLLREAGSETNNLDGIWPVADSTLHITPSKPIPIFSLHKISSRGRMHALSCGRRKLAQL